MRRQAMQFVAVARQTGLETLRSSAVLGVACGCMLSHALLPMTVSHTLGESGRMMADASLALHLLAGLLMGGFAACHGMTGANRGDAAVAILTKPVSPLLYYLARYAGIAAALALFSLMTTAAGLLGARAAAQDFTFDPWAALPLLAAPVLACLLAGGINFVSRRPFESMAFFFLVCGVAVAFSIGAFLDRRGEWMDFGSLYNLPLAQAHLLVAQAVWLLAAFALALASRLQTLSVLILSGAFFLFGMMSDYLFGRNADASRLAGWLYRLLPNWQVFWVMDALHEGRRLPLRFLAEVSLYGFFWGIAFLAFGLALFRHAEIRSRSG